MFLCFQISLRHVKPSWSLCPGQTVVHSSLRPYGQHRTHIKQSSQQRFPDSQEHALPRFKLVAPLPFFSNADTLLDILVDSELLIQVIWESLRICALAWFCWTAGPWWACCSCCSLDQLQQGLLRIAKWSSCGSILDRSCTAGWTELCDLSGGTQWQAFEPLDFHTF